jgi:hypothetical protein
MFLPSLLREIPPPVLVGATDTSREGRSSILGGTGGSPSATSRTSRQRYVLRALRGRRARSGRPGAAKSLTVAMKYAPLVLVMRRSRLAWRVSEMAIHSSPRGRFATLVIIFVTYVAV